MIIEREKLKALIALRLEEKGLSQRGVCISAGLQEDALRDFMRDKKTQMNVDVLDKILRQLDVSVTLGSGSQANSVENIEEYVEQVAYEAKSSLHTATGVDIPYNNYKTFKAELMQLAERQASNGEPVFISPSIAKFILEKQAISK